MSNPSTDFVLNLCDFPMSKIILASNHARIFKTLCYEGHTQFDISDFPLDFDFDSISLRALSDSCKVVELKLYKSNDCGRIKAVEAEMQGMEKRRVMLNKRSTALVEYIEKMDPGTIKKRRMFRPPVLIQLAEEEKNSMERRNDAIKREAKKKTVRATVSSTKEIKGLKLSLGYATTQAYWVPHYTLEQRVLDIGGATDTELRFSAVVKQSSNERWESVELNLVFPPSPDCKPDASETIYETDGWKNTSHSWGRLPKSSNGNPLLALTRAPYTWKVPRAITLGPDEEARLEIAVMPCHVATPEIHAGLPDQPATNDGGPNTYRINESKAQKYDLADRKGLQRVLPAGSVAIEVGGFQIGKVELEEIYSKGALYF
ncbi:hypothetical protein NP233_g79 [Leucocoprinus birnbaumii]|uniref:Uncharacterized protein n=1 Tax=Leucocoprinus birnbaumii TaxID=56174 RepID=A0AAD5YYV4_9AGAR|nr:hypothetical protein NP233_g79 [Leucocoprinus birnbaumii]